MMTRSIRKNQILPKNINKSAKEKKNRPQKKKKQQKKKKENLQFQTQITTQKKRLQKKVTGY